MATRTFPFVSQTRLEGRAEGLAEGRANSVLENLENRGIDVDDDSRARISSCTDVDVLKAWLRRSLTVTSVTDLRDILASGSPLPRRAA